MENRKAIIVFAEGFEEVEALTPADVLRRAGVDVALVGLERLVVEGAHGIALQMDRTLREREEVDAVILPGGMPGAENLSRSKTLLNILRGQLKSGKMVAAICASPGLVLGRNGLLKGRRATCYPGFEKHFGADAMFVEERVVKDGNLITSRGPGTAFDFALALTKELAGEKRAEEVGKGMLYLK
jgi:4-methyl-5(b-hydroxyethyl)-thiazole monophosphate biosynthesis